MSILDQLPKDQATALDVLAKLAEKDKDERVCSYPTCPDPRRQGTGVGKPPIFCENPEHNAVNNFRARKKLTGVAAGEAETLGRRGEVLLTGLVMESSRNTVVAGMEQLQCELERYASILADMTDPDLAAAREKANQDQTNVRVAEADQRASMEKELRLAAENANQAAQRDAQAARDATELAIKQLEDNEARMQQLREDTEQRVVDTQAACDAIVVQVREDAQRQIAEAQEQARNAVNTAEQIVAEAVQESREAREQQQEAEETARVEIATAKQLVDEAHKERDREREEVRRLRQELSEARQRAEGEQTRLLQTIEEMRQRAATDRTEMENRIERERADARLLVEREREETQRVRQDLQEARAQMERAERRSLDLTAQIDQLRDQLMRMLYHPPQNHVQDEDNP